MFRLKAVFVATIVMPIVLWLLAEPDAFQAAACLPFVVMPSRSAVSWPSPS